MKIFVLIYIAITSLLLISCSEKKTEMFVIGVSQCSDDEWRQIQNKEMLREAIFYPNLSLVFKTVKDDSNQQIKDIQSFIDQKIDLLIVSPNEAEKLTPIVERAISKNIPVVVIERKIASQQYTSFVGADNYEVGKTAAIFTSSILNNKGTIMEIRGSVGASSDIERHKGFSDEIRKYPNLKIIGQYHTEWYREDAEKIMNNALDNETHIDLVFAMSDRMALGVANQYEEKGLKKPIIVGVDALPGDNNGVDAIVNKTITASVIYPTEGDKIIQIAMDILEKRPYLKENILNTAIVDQSNARLIKMQHSQILEHQLKLNRMNAMLNSSMQKYTNQKSLLYAAVLVLVLITISLLMLFIANREKNKANKLLEAQNNEIKSQADKLKIQKDQLIQLSENLEVATQEKLSFFTNISHEFKTPLSLMMAPIESLKNNDNLTEKQISLINLCSQNSRLLLRLINEIIEFRAYDTGKLKLFLSLDNLKVFIDSLNMVFIDLAQQRKINFIYKSTADDIIMPFDKDKLEKIYYNLLSNAFKFVNDEGTITVTINESEVNNKKVVVLRVNNTGSLITKEEAPYIFNRFYKANNFNSGSGIGLALTKALVEIYNGIITVESSKENGTTFSVILPKEQNSKVEDNSNNHSPKLSFFKNNIDDLMPKLNIKTSSDNIDLDNTKPIVVIVEDNADMRDYLNLILNDEYTIIEADNGIDGIEKSIKFIPEVIISDVMMPGLDGYELCKSMKHNVTTSHIPVILLTANSIEEQKVIGFESGADAFIGKPFNPELLKIRVRKLIENREKIKKLFAGSLMTDSKKSSISIIEQGFIDKFSKHIEENISKVDLSVDEVAQFMGLSRVQLYRKIKAITNYSPNEMIRIIRLKQAKVLLTQKTKSVSEIAYETGFSSPSYFSKCFRDYYNENPTDFIK